MPDYYKYDFTNNLKLVTGSVLSFLTRRASFRAIPPRAGSCATVGLPFCFLILSFPPIASISTRLSSVR
jgi:hypothetical protein